MGIQNAATVGVAPTEENMLKFLAQAALTVALAVSSVAATATVTAAQDVELRIGPDGVRPVIRDRDRDRDRRDRRRDECSPREALSIARSEGLRRAEVTRITRRSVTVEGMTRRGPDRMVFANVRGCPEI
jgi:hypothetical protein